MKKSHIAKVITVLASVVVLSSCTQSVAVIPNQNAENVERTSTSELMTGSLLVDYSNIECHDIYGQVANGYRVANLVEEHQIQNPDETIMDFYIWDSNSMSLDESNNSLLDNPKLNKIASSSSCASYKVAVTSDVSNDFSIYMGSSYAGGTLQKTRQKESRDWELIYDSSKENYRQNLHTLSRDGRIHY